MGSERRRFKPKNCMEGGGRERIWGLNVRVRQKEKLKGIEPKCKFKKNRSYRAQEGQYI